MRHYWAIQIKPWGARSKPWIHHVTISMTRRDAWAKLLATGNDHWREQVKRRKRSGHMKAVKVTVTLA